mgnify:CR=1 FL=1
MTWGKLGPKGWGSHGDDTESSQGWFRQVLHTVVEVVAGGVLRAGKKRYTDDANVGWWLGVDADGLAKLNIGDAHQFLKWTGARVSVRGDLALQALLGKFDGGGVIWEDAAGDPVLSIGAQVDLGDISALTIECHHADSGLLIASEGFLILDPASGVVDVLYNRIGNVADATADNDAVSRSFGDGRYLRKTGGWSGTFAVGAQTVTVVNGQITGVA